MNPWVAGGMLAASTAVLAYALRGLTQPQKTPGFIVGGVDLSRTDLRSPFAADFSVPASSSPSVKRQAFDRFRYALEAFQRWQPGWMYRPQADAVSGRFVLYVFPLR